MKSMLIYYMQSTNQASMFTLISLWALMGWGSGLWDAGRQRPDKTKVVTLSPEKGMGLQLNWQNNQPLNYQKN